MRPTRGDALQVDDSHSLYLLGQRSSASPPFQRYRQLMQMCSKEGEFLSFETHAEWLACYERDAQSVHAKLPLLVFRPNGILNIAPFLQVCHQLSIPVTVRCGGTGLAGSCVPSKEGVVLLTGHLKQIRNYDGNEGTVCLEPGVTVRQLNHHVAKEGWYFPLAMATEGVAGIAGCLSSHSRGYHQQQDTLFSAIEHVSLVDGQGQILEVPAHVVCGAEGLWGVVIEIKLKLKRKLPACQMFLSLSAWQDVLAQLHVLRALQSLTFVIWHQNVFYLGLEGEAWRVPSAAAYLAQCLPDIQPMAELPSKKFLASYPNFVAISTAFHAHQLPEACAWSLEQAQHLQLECLQQADVLAGSLHLIVQAKDDAYAFQQKVEQFLILWADFVDRVQGILTSCHGVGMQMRPYMPPFWTEESQQSWRNLQAVFDPKELFGKERFFPLAGKSLEKTRQP